MQDKNINRVSGITTLDKDPWEDIRNSVKSLCDDFPGEYWRKLDSNRSYPEEFVEALTKAGYLACLIPEEYGGSGFTYFEYATVLMELGKVCGGPWEALGGPRDAPWASRCRCRRAPGIEKR